MMGERLVMQENLFYEFRLEEHVPSDHLLRRIDRFADCSELRQHLAGYYSATGRPSVDPELMIRVLLIGYCLGICSERRLCEEVHLNLAYRWFCRLRSPACHPAQHPGQLLGRIGLVQELKAVTAFLSQHMAVAGR
jgi:transposase